MSSKHHQKVYGCLAVSALHSAKELLESHSLYSALAQSDNNKWVISTAHTAHPKGGFFSESAIRFSDLQISKKNIPKNYPE